jgi:hypothetical protein
MHHNNINPNALDLFEEEKKKDERNGDLVKAEGVCKPLRELGQTHGVDLARPTSWVGFALGQLSSAPVSDS